MDFVSLVRDPISEDPHLGPDNCSHSEREVWGLRQMIHRSFLLRSWKIRSDSMSSKEVCGLHFVSNQYLRAWALVRGMEAT